MQDSKHNLLPNKTTRIHLCMRQDECLKQLAPQSLSNEDPRQWFVMRDLKRSNAKMPAYKMFQMLALEYFTPMTHRLITIHGKRKDMLVPFMQDLLFVKETRERLDPIVERTPTLQYRYAKGAQRTPMVVPSKDMERFIHAVSSVKTPQYYRPSEITPSMLNKVIRIVGGLLDGYEGYLLTTRGSRVKHLLLELPGFLVASIEVDPEYIELL